MRPQYHLNLSRYDIAELGYLLEAGVISVAEFEAELAIRPALPDSEAVLTPPGSRCTTDEKDPV